MAVVVYYVDRNAPVQGNGQKDSPWLSILDAFADTGFLANAGNDVILRLTGSIPDDVGSGRVQIYSNLLAKSLHLKGDGFVSTGQNPALYLLRSSDAYLIDMNDFAGDILISDIQVELTLNNGHSSNRVAIGSGSKGSSTGSRQVRNAHVKIINNDVISGRVLTGVVFSDTDDPTISNYVNNVVVECHGSGITRGFRKLGSSAVMPVYNSVTINADIGFMQVAVLKNSAAVGCTDAWYSPGGILDISNNFSDDGAGDAGFTHIDFAREFVDVEDGDITFTLDASVLPIAGVDVSAENGYITTDAAGLTRTLPWSIGPFESKDPELPDVNTAPLSADQRFAVDETAAVGTAVGTVVVTDLDGGPLTYSIIAGNASNAFTIDANTGLLAVAAGLDYRAIAQYVLKVLVADSDNASVVTDITIDLLPQTISPPTDALMAEFVVNPGSATQEKRTLYPGNTHLVEVRNLHYLTSKAAVNDAAVEVTLKASGINVAGQSWPTTLSFAEEGHYWGTLNHQLDLANTVSVDAEFSISTPGGSYGAWTIPLRVAKRSR